MYRAERLDGKGKVEGCLIDNDFNNIPTICFTDTEYDEGRKVDFFNMVSIKPETLEIYLFGEWRKVSELEKPCEWSMCPPDDIHLLKTSCGKKVIMSVGDFKFCPYCGRPIKEI